MESLVGNEFDVPSKNSSEEALKRWRQAVTILKNPKRRFRYCADLEKRRQDEQKKLSIQEKIRVALYVQKAALQFIDAGSRVEYMLSEEVRQAGFGIDPNELASIVRGHDSRRLKQHGEVGGIARKVSVSLENGVISKELPVRQNIYGSNKYVEKPPRSLWVFIWEALQDLTLIILMVCAVVSVGVGIATEGLPKGIYDGLGIILCIFLVVMVTAISDYKQSLQFRDLDKEKKNISVHVTRDGYRQKVSIHDLVVGDIVHLSIGDVVPADGMYISGYSLLIDESSLSGESEPVNVNHSKPFLLSGTSVRNGSGKMLVTAVGMRTEWGRLMETLSESGENETPLQVKLNGVATLIGKIGLAFAVMTFLVLVVRFLVEKGLHSELLKWSLSDVVEILNYFAIAVTIIVVAVPEGLPLAVTLSLAFAMKKLMSDHALVRHLSACETMGSVTSICTDKTGTLTTNHMIVDKIWICESVKGNNIMNALKSTVSEEVLRTLLQCIFQNTSAEVVEGKDGKTKILGSPTESALIEFGSFLGGDYGAQRRESKIVKIEPFNSDRKKMSVLVALQRGRFRAFCKGASELVVQMCDKIIDSKGEFVHLSKSKIESGMEVINSFACEALRTLCLAFKDLNENNGNNIPDHGYTLIAVIGIKDPLRPGVKDAVQTCLSAGVTVRMVTGDNINTAKAIAKECGILTEGGLATEGQEFRQWTPQQIKESISLVQVALSFALQILIVDHIQYLKMLALYPQVMARSLPMDKHAFVTELRNLEEVVAVTGDGTNDAPALHEANIGLAMGIEGTEVAKENADVIIMDDNFTTIVNLAKWGRAVYINIQKFVQFQLTVNIVALMTNFISACISGAAPLTAVQLLWVNMIMDTLGALALATDPPNDEMMKRPPVGKGVNIITGPMWKNIIGQSIYQLAILSILTFCGKGVLRFLRLGGWNSSSVLNTLIFNTFVLCQVFNEINCRDIEKINVFRGMLNNWIFISIMVSTVTFQIIIVEFLGTFASTVPLSWQLWLFSILIGAISLPIGVVLKLIPCKSSIKGNTTKHHDGYEELPSGPEMA